MTRIYSITLSISLLLHLASAITAENIRIKVLLASGTKYELQSQTSALKFTAKGLMVNGKRFPSIKGNYYFAPKEPLKIGKIKCKGQFLLLKTNPKKANYLLILSLPLEHYLGGVLEGEISHSWPAESIKVQAIAARTYAYWIINNSGNRRYHIKSDTSHQVFKGNEGVHPSFKKAIRATSGIILTYKRSPIQTFFTATCGGQTEKPVNVWNSPTKMPHFKSIKCPYCTTHPKYKWTAKLSAKKIKQKLKTKLPGLRSIRSIRIVKYSPSRRALTLEINDGSRKNHLSGNAFRLTLGGTTIQSLRFKLKKQGNYYLFKGNGYGHGVGLCQWGAKTMAQKGYSHRKILQFYYKQVKMKKI